MIGSYCFVVFSEQLPPRRFAVSTLTQSLQTQSDKNTFIELGGHVGAILTRQHADIMSSYMQNGNSWQFIETVRTTPYIHTTKQLPKHLRNCYVNCSLQYAFPEKVQYQVGTDRRLLMCYSIIEDWTGSTRMVDLKDLLSVTEPIVYNCAAYMLGFDGYLHMKTNKSQEGFQYNSNDFPCL